MKKLGKKIIQMSKKFPNYVFSYKGLIDSNRYKYCLCDFAFSLRWNVFALIAYELLKHKRLKQEPKVDTKLCLRSIMHDLQRIML